MRHVRYWHLADIAARRRMSLSGVKRTLKLGVFTGMRLGDFLRCVGGRRSRAERYPGAGNIGAHQGARHSFQAAEVEGRAPRYAEHPAEG